MPLPENVVQVRIGNDHFLDTNGAPLTGDVLRVFPTEQRFVDGSAKSIIYGTVAEATVDDNGAAWVVVPATDNTTLDSTFSYGINEPDGQTGYWVVAPSTAPVDAGTGLPSLDLSLAVHAPAPITGVVQLFTGGVGLLTGGSVPSNTIGVDGQAYIDTTHGKLYVKASGAWNSGLSLVGGGGGVTSVNGHVGVVSLSASDVSAVDTSLVGANGGLATLDAGGDVPLGELGNAPSGGGGGGAVASINGHTGVVVLTSTDVGAVAVGDSRLSDQRAPVTTFVNSRPVNVRYTGNPLADAIMDGGTHALSTRFVSLSAAQAVFPTATALTEQIDYHAIQLQLNGSAPKVYLSWGTAVLHKALLTKAGGNQEIAGEGNATVLTLTNGANSNVISPADATNANPNMCFHDFVIDGNKANNTGTIGQTDGLFMWRVDNLKIYNIESRNVNGRGLHHNGLSGTTVQQQQWSNIYCHDNQHWGIWNSNGVRKVNYDNITCSSNGLRTDIGLNGTGNAADNFTGGMLMDHSEATLTNYQAHLNGQDGLWIRNVFACSFNGIRTTQNGRHGIRVLGLVDSLGSDWLSQSNGQNASLPSYDIWFDGTGTLNYGVTSRTKITNVVAGPDNAATVATQGSWTGGEDYAIYFDDNMTNGDLDISYKTYAGSTGTVRLPTAGLGSLRINDGTGLEKVNNVLATGTTEVLPDINVATMHRLVLTANCAITIPAPAIGKIITVQVIQDSVGTRTVTWASAGGGTIKWAGGGTPPTLTTIAGGADVVGFVSYDGTHWIGTVVDQNV